MSTSSQVCVEIRALQRRGWTPEGATFLGSKRRIINIILHFYLEQISKICLEANKPLFCECISSSHPSKRENKIYTHGQVVVFRADFTCS
jgi:hypothetical protein